MTKVKVSLCAVMGVFTLCVLLATSSLCLAQINQIDSLGRKHGSWVEYYSNKKIKSIAWYERDTLHGEYCTYHKDGSPQSYVEYAMGKPHGIRIYWEQGGNRIYFTQYQMGQRVYYVKIVRGIPNYEEIYQSGEKIEVRYYNEEGEIVGIGRPWKLHEEHRLNKVD